jgi:hypothetical protein
MDIFAMYRSEIMNHRPEQKTELERYFESTLYAESGFNILDYWRNKVDLSIQS